MAVGGLAGPSRNIKPSTPVPTWPVLTSTVPRPPPVARTVSRIVGPSDGPSGSSSLDVHHLQLHLQPARFVSGMYMNVLKRTPWCYMPWRPPRAVSCRYTRQNAVRTVSDPPAPRVAARARPAPSPEAEGGGRPSHVRSMFRMREIGYKKSRHRLLSMCRQARVCLRTVLAWVLVRS